MLSRTVRSASRGTVLHLSSVLNRFHGHQYASGPILKNSRFAYPEGMVAYEEDYVEKPEYPEIDPEIHDWNEHKRLRRQKILEFHKKIREQPNVEAKTLELNMQRKFGWVVQILTEDIFEYDSQSVYKFMTRTHLESSNKLPDFYSSQELTEKAKYFAEKVNGPLLDVLRLEMDGINYENDLSKYAHQVDFQKTQSLVYQINRIILSVLGKEIDHLRECQVDYSPNIEAFWFLGGQMPSGTERAMRKGYQGRKNEWNRSKIKEDDPVERNMHYKGSPVLQLRCENPIQNFVAENSELCKRSEAILNRYPYNLNAFGIHKEMKFGSFITGSWSGDSHKCSHIAFHPRHHLLQDVRRNNKYWVEDTEEALASQAILASFGRLVSQSMYYGFDQFSDLNYPFSTQTIVTDGINWSFFAYQLNTIKLSQLHLEKNQKQNVCWGTTSSSIFDQKEPNKLNEDVVQTLLKFYLSPPTPIAVENPTPYVKSPLESLDDEIQREIIYYNYRDMVAQRWYRSDGLISRQFPEIYDWERIYKVSHPQRHIDPRRRFFELPEGVKGSRPYTETYPLLNPRKVRRGLRTLQEGVAARKEEERLEAAKLAETLKYAGGYDEEKP